MSLEDLMENIKADIREFYDRIDDEDEQDEYNNMLAQSFTLISALNYKEFERRFKDTDSEHD